MPNGHGPKEYGDHRYPGGEDQTSDCAHHCGCWAGPSRSGGPAGIDPFGACPRNPLDGKLLGGKQDYEHVVNGRISSLEGQISTLQERCRQAEKKLEEVSPEKEELAERISSLLEQLEENKRVISAVNQALSSI